MTATTPISTAARERLAGLHSRLNDLRATVSTLMARAMAGEDVDLTEVTSAEASIAVAERVLPSVQALAQAEEHAEQWAAWEPVEAAALAEHRLLANNLHDTMDLAREALAAVVTSAVQVNGQVARFVNDPRRPPAILANTHPALAGEVRSTAAGERMHTAPTARVIALLAAEAMAAVRAAGEPVPISTAQALSSAGIDLVLPADHRGVTDSEASA